MQGIQALMKQAQEMQKKMTQMQEEIAGRSYEGFSGGKLVTVVINGKSEMQKVMIDPSLLKEEEKEVLEDLIIAAYNDARHRLEGDSSGLMAEMTQGLNLPPGMKLPF